MQNYSFSLADVKVNFTPYEDPDLTIFFFFFFINDIIQQIKKKFSRLTYRLEKY